MFFSSIQALITAQLGALSNALTSSGEIAPLSAP
jgi:hypothetical protein